METLRARWEGLREPIARLAVGYPSARARELADEVSSGLHRTVNWVGWALTDLARHQSIAESMETAMHEWGKLDLN
jgi:hypothetical protein